MHPPIKPSLEQVFKSAIPARDKFLSRLFGIFSEDVVRHWCACPEAPYTDLGRPYVKLPEEKSGHTLDFTLQNRATGQRSVVELKCELEYTNYAYLNLTGYQQIEHHKSPAFVKFLRLAREPAALDVRIGGKPTTVAGAILVWGSVTEGGREAAMKQYGLADVLSIEQMLADLHRWAPSQWQDRVAQLRGWCNELFDYLA